MQSLSGASKSAEESISRISPSLLVKTKTVTAISPTIPVIDKGLESVSSVTTRKGITGMTIISDETISKESGGLIFINEPRTNKLMVNEQVDNKTSYTTRIIEMNTNKGKFSLATENISNIKRQPITKTETITTSVNKTTNNTPTIIDIPTPKRPTGIIDYELIKTSKRLKDYSISTPKQNRRVTRYTTTLIGQFQGGAKKQRTKGTFTGLEIRRPKGKRRGYSII